MQAVMQQSKTVLNCAGGEKDIGSTLQFSIAAKRKPLFNLPVQIMHKLDMPSW